jgi:hypothetical protein
MSLARLHLNEQLAYIDYGAKLQEGQPVTTNEFASFLMCVEFKTKGLILRHQNG